MKKTKEKSLVDWCVHFREYGTDTKTQAKTHLTCEDCIRHNYGNYEESCPYERDEGRDT